MLIWPQAQYSAPTVAPIQANLNLAKFTYEKKNCQYTIYHISVIRFVIECIFIIHIVWIIKITTVFYKFDQILDNFASDRSRIASVS